MKDDDHPFLAYSPIISIENSSEPFQAFLGAILSVIKGVAIVPSTFDPDMERILREDSLGVYPGTRTATSPPLTHARKRVLRPRSSD